ncbi:MAG: hypothetical protein KAW52_00505 [candidate division Zixibacteria bacterium]|nr:hypothetical protein [candidate division Zixibacteria bacterium]
MAKKKIASKRGGGKKSVKKKSSRTRAESPMVSKPTLTIDSKRLSGNSFRVGKKARVVVTGKIVEESLRNYEAEGRKSYRMEIDRVSALKKTKRSRK